jgi:hypothetical protein
MEMKRRGSEAIYERIKDMSREEELEYWRKRTEELLAEQAKLREESREVVKDG